MYDMLYYMFPSPHSGILFLFKLFHNVIVRDNYEVSVPSFGDSFFMGLNRPTINNEDINGFPSPHSGILFL